MHLDRFDTPAAVAEKMVAAVVGREQSVIVDFSVGGGSLLYCAAERWPRAKIAGVDVNPEAIRELRSRHPDWALDCADFLDQETWKKSRLLKSIARKASLVLLNPPFSCRGAKTFSGLYQNRESISCSLAMAFLINSLGFLKSNGEVVAILPSGLLHSERDREALSKLRSTFSFEVIEECGMRIFGGCSVRTFVAHIAPRKQKEMAPRRLIYLRTGLRVSLHRGGAQMHSVKHSEESGCLPLVHTTQMVDNRLLPGRINVAKGKSVHGPMILLPRVGEPAKSKIVMIAHEQRFVLSDCVIAILGGGREQTAELYRRITDNWISLSALYGGTCARYLTLRSLTHFLSTLGCTVESTGGTTPINGSLPSAAMRGIEKFVKEKAVPRRRAQ